MTRWLSLVVRNVVFTVVVPGLGGVWLPWRLLTHGHGLPAPAAWEAVPGHRGRGGALLLVRLDLRHRGRRHPGPVGRAAPRGRARALPLGPQPDLPRGAPGRAGGGVAVHLAAAARLRGRHGGLLPPVRHRLRGTDAGPPLRPRLPGVPARRPALDPAQAAATPTTGPPAREVTSR